MEYKLEMLQRLWMEGEEDDVMNIIKTEPQLFEAHPPLVNPSREHSPCRIVPTLQNVVSLVRLECWLDLKEIVMKARNAEYNPNRFSAAIMRIREPRATALFFSSGKMICIGARNIELSRIAARKFARIIQKLGFPAKFKDFKVENIVASCDVEFPVRLEQLAVFHAAFVRYDPELFPGLVYRMKQPKVTLIVFASGKVILTGAMTITDINTAIQNLYPVLVEYRRNK